MTAESNQTGSPRYQVRLDDAAQADLDVILGWLGERQPEPTPSDALRLALRHTAESIKKNLRILVKKA